MPAYPKNRTPFYCMKIWRYMLKYRAATVIGTDGMCLVMTIGAEEDRMRYRQPAVYHNHDLMSILKISKQETFRGLRARCVEAGWLVYKPAAGGSRQAGTYWIAIPDSIAFDVRSSASDDDRLTDSEGSEVSQPLFPTLADTLADERTSKGSTLADTLADERTPSYPITLIQEPITNTNTKSARDWATLFEESEPSEPAASNGSAHKVSDQTGVREQKPARTSRKPKPSKPTDPAAKPELPPELDTFEFKDAWDEWHEHRHKTLKLPMTARSAKRFIKKCAAWGSEKAIRAIHRSIDSGKWSDLYDPDEAKITANATATKPGRFDYVLPKLPSEKDLEK